VGPGVCERRPSALVVTVYDCGCLPLVSPTSGGRTLDVKQASISFFDLFEDLSEIVVTKKLFPIERDQPGEIVRNSGNCTGKSMGSPMAFELTRLPNARG